MAEDKEKVPDPEVSRLLQTIVEKFENEDRPTRERQLRQYRKLKLYWNNMSRIYWSETARDYRIASNIDTTDADIQQAYYDRPMNVFRAFLETIIAALSVHVPTVNCVPDDADNPLDLATAKAGNIISEQIYRHNNAILIWLEALYTWCTEGLVGCYQYVKEDESYGTYEHKEYKDEEIEAYVCPTCQAQLSDEAFSAAVENMYGPDDEDSLLLGTINELGPVCPECGELLDENLQKSTTIIQRLVGVTTKPRSRICLSVWGGLYIKVAQYAKKQCDTPYLTLTYSTHYANAIKMYEHLRSKISKSNGNAGGIGGNDSYDRVYRQNTEYGGELPDDNVTVKYAWLRPAAFNVVSEDDTKKLKELFPQGVMVCFVNESCGEYRSEALDDVWTLTKNPLADYLTHEPAGELLVNVQDIVNDLISLTLQTIEHGVTQVWADPAVVNFNGMAQIESNPGMLTAVKAQGGTRNISDAFFTTSAASLAPETLKFYEIIQSLGQFVSGAMPSIFGGTQGKNSSGTASEYAMQKSMALQRLQTPWKMLTIWWKESMGKAIPAYMKEVQSDERVVKKDKNGGGFVNQFIRKAELAGKIGDIELENADTLPVTDEQKADVIMRLMDLNNQDIMQAMTIPENLPFVRKVVKIPEFTLPGEDDRNKQFEEINKLLNGEMVEIEPDIDNSEIHADICRGWAVSEAGRYAKEMNPVGYMMVLEHFKMHMMIVQQTMMAQAALAGPETAPTGKGQSKLPKGTNEVKGEKDVRTPVQ